MDEKPNSNIGVSRYCAAGSWHVQKVKVTKKVITARTPTDRDMNEEEKLYRKQKTSQGKVDRRGNRKRQGAVIKYKGQRGWP